MAKLNSACRIYGGLRLFETKAMVGCGSSIKSAKARQIIRIDISLLPGLQNFYKNEVKPCGSGVPRRIGDCDCGRETNYLPSASKSAFRILVPPYRRRFDFSQSLHAA